MFFVKKSIHVCLGILRMECSQAVKRKGLQIKTKAFNGAKTSLDRLWRLNAIWVFVFKNGTAILSY